MSQRRNNPGRNYSKSSSKIARLRDKALRLRDRIKQSEMAFLRRRESRLAWWQTAFRTPLVGFHGWVRSRCSSMWAAMMTILGLSRPNRLAPRASSIKATKKYRQSFTRSMLHAENLEQRQLLAADLYVDDLASDYDLTSDTGSPAVAGYSTGDTVTWAGANGVAPAGAPDGDDMPGLIVDTDAFITIQAAIDAATMSGQIIRLAPGTYTENLNINKSVTIVAANSDPSLTVLSGTHTVTSNGVVIDGVTFNTPGTAVTVDSTASTIDNVEIKNSVFNLPSPGIGVHVGLGGMAISNVNLHNNTFDGPASKISNPFKVGGSFGSPVSQQITGLMFADNMVNEGSIPLNLGNQNLDQITISGNTFTDTDGAVYVWNDAGVWTGVLSNFVFENNSVDATNSYGVALGLGTEFSAANFGTGNVVRFNQLEAGSAYGLGAVAMNFGTATLDAQKNFWGDATGPSGQGSGVGSTAVGSGTVDFTPWYATSTTTITTENVTVDTGLAGTSDDIAYSDTIQGGLDAASATNTVTVAAGTYVEDLVIPMALNDLDLVGAGAGSSIIQGIAVNPQASFPLAAPNINVLASGVKIHGFTIQTPNVAAGFYSSGLLVDSQDVEIFNNAFVSSQGDAAPASNDSLTNVLIQTWAGSNSGKASDVDGLSIHNNTFTGNGKGYYGIFVNPQAGTVDSAISIADNGFSGDIWRAIEVERSSASINGNTIAGTAASKTWGGSGISVRDFGTAIIDDVTISENTIGSVTNGLLLGFSTETLSNVTVTENDISGNQNGVVVNQSADGIDFFGNLLDLGQTKAIINNDAATLDASFNFWGPGATAATIAPKLTENPGLITVAPFNTIVADATDFATAVPAGSVTVFNDGGLIRVVDDAGNNLATPVPLAWGVSVVDVTGRNSSSDKLTVDVFGLPAGFNVKFEGGGAGGTDTLNLIDSNPTPTPWATITHTFTSETDGKVELAGGATITYTGLEPITDNMSATNRNFTFTGAAESIALGNSPMGGFTHRIDSTLGELVDFNLPSNSLTVIAGTGDSINISKSVTGISVDLQVPTVTLSADIGGVGTAGTVTGTATTVNVNNGAVIQDGINAGNPTGLVTLNLGAGTYGTSGSPQNVTTAGKQIKLLPTGFSSPVINGNLTMDGNDTLTIPVKNTAVNNPTLVVNGLVALGGATLQIDASAVNMVLPSTPLTIINNDTAVDGNGLFGGIIEGNAVASNGTLFKVSYVGGDGNNVTLTPVSVTLDANDTPPAEGGPNGQFSVILSSAVVGPTVITYSVGTGANQAKPGAAAGGTASDPNDYQALSGTVTVLSGNTVAVIDVNVFEDATTEDSAKERVELTLQTVKAGSGTAQNFPYAANSFPTPGPAVAPVGQRADVVNIIDNDASSITISSATDNTINTENSADTGTFVFSLNKASSTATEVWLNIPQPNPASKASFSDWTSTLSNGATLNTSPVTSYNINNVSRTSDVATVTTTAAHGFVVGQQVVVDANVNSFDGTVVITGVPTTTTFTYANVGIDESSGATGTVKTVSNALLTIPAGVTQVTMVVSATADLEVELDETIDITMEIVKSGLPTVGAANSATVTIIDDDAGVVSLAPNPTNGTDPNTNPGSTTSFPTATNGSIIAELRHPTTNQLVTSSENVVLTYTIAAPPAHAQVVYFNNFSSNTNGFTTSNGGNGQVTRSSNTLELRKVNNTNPMTSANSAVLTVDLSSAKTTGGAVLRFDHQRLSSEGDDNFASTAATATPFTVDPDVDGVAISTDGINWYPVLNLGNASSYTINLEKAAYERGLELTSNFQIKFLQFSNSTTANNNAGRRFDNVEVISGDYDPLSSTTTGTVTILAGNSTASIPVNVINDLVVEGSENVTVTLNQNTSSSNGDVTVTNNSVARTRTVTITDQDTAIATITPGVSVGKEAGPVDATFKVTLLSSHTTGLPMRSDTDTTIPFEVDTSVLMPNATYGVDYTLTGSNVTITSTTGTVKGTVKIPAGQTQSIITVSVINETDVEDDEWVSVKLLNSNIVGRTPQITANTTPASVAIQDNDQALVRINGLTNGVEGDPAGPASTPGRFFLDMVRTLDGMTTKQNPIEHVVSNVDTVITYTVTGTANNPAGSDFTPLSGTVTITKNTTFAWIDVNVLNDLNLEPDETVIITLDSITSGDSSVKLHPNQKSDDILIKDNDTLTVKVRKEAAQTAAISTISRSASNVVTLTSAGHTFGKGQTIVVSGVADTSFNGTFVVTSVTANTITYSQVGAAASSTGGNVLTFDALEVAGDNGGGPTPNDGLFTLYLDGDATAISNYVTAKNNLELANPGMGAGDVVVTFTLTGLASNGLDYTSVPGSATIAPNSTSVAVDIDVINDLFHDPNETVTLTITGIASQPALGLNQAGVGADNTPATLTIVDDEMGQVYIDTIVDARESNTNGSITFRLTNPSPFNTVINYVVTPSGAAPIATQGSDHNFFSGQVTFTAGQTMSTLVVPVLNDMIVEDTEIIPVQITGFAVGGNGGGYGFDNTVKNVKILADQTVDIVGVTNGSEGGAVSPRFTIGMQAPSTAPTVVTYEILTAAGDAVNGTDFATISTFTATIPIGATTTNVVISVTDDALIEDTENLTIRLVSVSNVDDPDIKIGPQNQSTTFTEGGIRATHVQLSGNVATITLAQNHGWQVNDLVDVSLMPNNHSTSFNGLGKTITAVTANTISFNVTSGGVNIPLSTTSGSVVRQGDSVGNLPSTARSTFGTRGLQTIAGSLNTNNDQDMYLIHIDDPAAFMATAAGGMTSPLSNSQLFLFDTTGKGVIGDDDSGPGTHAKLTLNALTTVPAPGFYYLAISSKGSDPQNGSNLLWLNDEVNQKPNGVGQNLPVTSWTGGGTDQGSYEIALTGAKFASFESRATLSIADNDAGYLQVSGTKGTEGGDPIKFTVTQSAKSSTNTVFTYELMSGGTGPAHANDNQVASTKDIESEYKTYTGTILAGETSAMVTVNVTDDNLIEGDLESVKLSLLSLTNADPQIKLGSVLGPNLVFKQGAAPSNLTTTLYNGTVDTYISQVAPLVSYGSVQVIHVEADDTTDNSDGATHGLIRFNNIIGSGLIPANSTIAGATLNFTVAGSAIVNLHEVLNQNWNGSSTWTSSFGGNGVQGNGTEASPVFVSGNNTFGVTETVQGWVNGNSNFGWAILPTSPTADWDAESSEAALGDRPMLMINIATSSTVVICDNDNTTVNISSVIAGQEPGGPLTTGAGDTNSGKAIISIGQPSSTDTFVTYTITDGTATGGGIDHNAPTQTKIATISAGMTSTTVKIEVTDDFTVEGTENVIVTLGQVLYSSTSAVTNKVATAGPNGTATLTVPGHNFIVGQTLQITGVGSGLDGTRTISGVTGSTISFDWTGAAVTSMPVTGGAASFTGTDPQITKGANDTGTVPINDNDVGVLSVTAVDGRERNPTAVTQKQLTNNVARLRSPGHGLTAADIGGPLFVTGVGAPFDGSYIISNISGDNIFYARTAANVGNMSSSGGTLTAGPVHGKFVISTDFASDVATAIPYQILVTTAGKPLNDATIGAGNDYTLMNGTTTLTGTVTLPPLVTSVEVTINVLEDFINEGDETVTLKLMPPTAGKLTVPANAQDTATIVDDDVLKISLVATDKEVTEGSDAGANDGFFTVGLNYKSDSDVQVVYTVQTTDVVGNPTFREYASNVATLTIPNHTFQVGQHVVVAGVGSAYNGPRVITAVTTGASGTIKFAVGAGSEGNVATTGTVTLPVAKAGPMTAQYTNGNDYAPLDGSGSATTKTILIQAGQTQFQLPVEAYKDLFNEDNEAVVVKLDSFKTFEPGTTTESNNFSTTAPPVNGNPMLDPNKLTDTVTIIDEVFDVTILKTDSPATEPGLGAGGFNGQFTVFITNPLPQDLFVEVTDITASSTTAPNGKAILGTDYTYSGSSNPVQTVTILAGQTSAPLTVTVINDDLSEGLEDVVVMITDLSDIPTPLPTGATLLSSLQIGTPNKATETIRDEDKLNVTITAENGVDKVGPLVSEKTNGKFIFDQGFESPYWTKISYEIDVPGTTATSGTDYTAIPAGTVTIAGGSGSRTTELLLNVLGDAIVEGDEFVKIKITNIETFTDATLTTAAPNPAMGIGNTGTATIKDEDTANITISTLTHASETTGIGFFTVQLSNPSSSDTVVGYSVTGGTAMEGATLDYTQAPLASGSTAGFVTLTAGQTQAFISVSVLDDNIVEANPETVEVTLAAAPQNPPTDPQISVSTTQNVATMNITDNDVAKVTVMKTADTAEGSSTAGNFVFSLVDAATGLVPKTADIPVTVQYEVTGKAKGGAANSTSVNGPDYLTLSGSIVISGGTQASLPVTAFDDAFVESTEDVVVRIVKVTAAARAVSPVTAIAEVSNKSRSGVTRTLTTVGNHGYKVGDVISVQINDNDYNTPNINFPFPTTTILTVPSPNTFTYSLGTTTGVNGAASGTVGLVPTSFTVTNRSEGGTGDTEATLEIGTHNFVAGDTVVVAINDAAYNGTFVITSTGATSITYDKGSNAGGSGAARGHVALAGVPATVTGGTLSSNVVTLTTSTKHGFLPGQIVTVAIGDPVFDGTHVVVNVTNTTLTYNKANADTTAVITATSPTVSSKGSATVFIADNDTSTLSVSGASVEEGNSIGDLASDGSAGQGAVLTLTLDKAFDVETKWDVMFGDPTARTILTAESNSEVVTLTFSSNHGFTVGQAIVVSGAGSLNGTYKVTGVPSSNTVSFARPTTPDGAIPTAVGGSVSWRNVATPSLTGDNDNGTDYDGRTQTITFAAGQKTKSFKVDFNEEDPALAGISHLVEDDEIFGVNVKANATTAAAIPANKFDATTTSVVTIENDDTATYKINNASVVEGDPVVKSVTGNKELSGNVVTLTLGANHGINVGDTFEFAQTPGDSVFDGRFIAITGTMNNILKYAKTNADVASSSITNGVLTTFPAPVTTNVTGTFQASGTEVTLTLGANHNIAVGDTFEFTQTPGNSAIDGRFVAIAGTTNNILKYASTTAATGPTAISNGVLTQFPPALLTFTVSVDNPVDMPINVTVNYTDDAGVLGAKGNSYMLLVPVGTDYNKDPGSVSFGTNSTTPQTVGVRITPDMIVEGGTSANPGSETFTAGTGINSNSFNVIPQGARQFVNSDTGKGTIIDNDSAEITFSVTDSVAAEPNPVNNGQYRIVQSKPSSVDTVIELNIATGGVNATQGVDYELRVGSTVLTDKVTIPAGQTEVLIDVIVIPDGVVEADEFVNLSLGNFVSRDPNVDYPFGPNGQSLQVRIENTTSTALSVRKSKDGAEPGLPAQDGEFIVELGQTSSTQTVVYYTVLTSGDTGFVAPGATPGVDYTALTGSVTISANTLSATIAVDVLNDFTPAEGTEHVTIRLDSFAGAANIAINPAAQIATVDITEGGGLFISIDVPNSDLIANEENVEPGFFVLQLTDGAGNRVTVPAGNFVDVTYDIVTGSTATSADYQGTIPNVVRIPAGASTALVQITPVDDTLDEGTEELHLTIQSAIPTGGSLGAISNGNLAPTPLPITSHVDIIDNDFAIAKVESVVVNGGQQQRSMLTSVQVKFDQPVAAPAAAFSIVKKPVVGSGGTPTPVTGLVVSAPDYTTEPGKTIVTITFDGGSGDPLVFDRAGSRADTLVDGNYELDIDQTQVVTLAGGRELDGDNNGTAGGDYTAFGSNAVDKFFRIFGDGDGSGIVDPFGDVFGPMGILERSNASDGVDALYVDYFDHDGNGVIDPFGDIFGALGVLTQSNKDRDDI